MKGSCAWESEEGRCVNCCLRTYQSSCRSFYLKKKKNKKKKRTKTRFYQFLYLSLTGRSSELGYFLDERPLQKHSKPSKKS